jgi:hypothetical protein
LPALEHHTCTYSEDDVEEDGIKIKKNITFFFMKMAMLEKKLKN